MAAIVNDIGAIEAKADFARLLDRVEGGEEFTISRSGHPVARLVPAMVRRSPNDRREAIEKMRQLAARHKLNGISIRELIEEGRK
ncbi:MAG: type II toxin-antitoxin system prevent-host-death family antitoxin [Gemmataceae bacterium]|nr:type II toxin-antitoxin system prevent-host-death family antitoxin [Gemmataceae bacterium]